MIHPPNKDLRDSRLVVRIFGTVPAVYFRHVFDCVIWGLFLVDPPYSVVTSTCLKLSQSPQSAYCRTVPKLEHAQSFHWYGVLVALGQASRPIAVDLFDRH